MKIFLSLKTLLTLKSEVLKVNIVYYGLFYLVVIIRSTDRERENV